MARCQPAARVMGMLAPFLDQVQPLNITRVIAA
jgi:hypothetical protein